MSSFSVLKSRILYGWYDLQFYQLFYHCLNIGHTYFSGIYSSWMVIGFRGRVALIDMRKYIYMLRMGLLFIDTAVFTMSPVWFTGMYKSRSLLYYLSLNAFMCGEFSCTGEWINGLLSNFLVVLQSIGRMFKLPIVVRPQNFFTNSINNWLMTRFTWPRVVFISNVFNSFFVAKESLSLGIPCVGVIDTNTETYISNIGLPSNDDAALAVLFNSSVVSSFILFRKSVYVVNWFNNVRKASRALTFYKWFLKRFRKSPIGFNNFGLFFSKQGSFPFFNRSLRRLPWIISSLASFRGYTELVDDVVSLPRMLEDLYNIKYVCGSLKNFNEAVLDKRLLQRLHTISFNVSGSFYLDFFKKGLQADKLSAIFSRVKGFYDFLLRKQHTRLLFKNRQRSTYPLINKNINSIGSIRQIFGKNYRRFFHFRKKDFYNFRFFNLEKSFLRKGFHSFLLRRKNFLLDNFSKFRPKAKLGKSYFDSNFYLGLARTRSKKYFFLSNVRIPAVKPVSPFFRWRVYKSVLKFIRRRYRYKKYKDLRLLTEKQAPIYFSFIFIFKMLEKYGYKKLFAKIRSFDFSSKSPLKLMNFLLKAFIRKGFINSVEYNHVYKPLKEKGFWWIPNLIPMSMYERSKQNAVLANQLLPIRKLLYFLRFLTFSAAQEQLLKSIMVNSFFFDNYISLGNFSKKIYFTKKVYFSFVGDDGIVRRRPSSLIYYFGPVNRFFLRRQRVYRYKRFRSFRRNTLMSERFNFIPAFARKRFLLRRRAILRFMRWGWFYLFRCFNRFGPRRKRFNKGFRSFLDFFFLLYSINMFCSYYKELSPSFSTKLISVGKRFFFLSYLLRLRFNKRFDAQSYKFLQFGYKGSSYLSFYNFRSFMYEHIHTYVYGYKVKSSLLSASPASSDVNLLKVNTDLYNPGLFLVSYKHVSRRLAKKFFINMEKVGLTYNFRFSFFLRNSFKDYLRSSYIVSSNNLALFRAARLIHVISNNVFFWKTNLFLVFRSVFKRNVIGSQAFNKRLYPNINYSITSLNNSNNNYSIALLFFFKTYLYFFLVLFFIFLNILRLKLSTG